MRCNHAKYSVWLFTFGWSCTMWWRNAKRGGRAKKKPPPIRDDREPLQGDEQLSVAMRHMMRHIKRSLTLKSHIIGVDTGV